MARLSFASCLVQIDKVACDTYTALEVAMATDKKPLLLMAKLIHYYPKLVRKEILSNFLEIL